MEWRPNPGSIATEVPFERKLPTLTKLEATPGDRIDLRTSGQVEESHLLNDEQAKVFFNSSYMKEVLKSPNKFTMIDRILQTESNISLHHRERLRKSWSTEM